MRKPIIGIVSRPGIIFDQYDVQVSEETYRNAIISCGGIPITILPPQIASYNSVKPRDMERMTDSEKEDLNHILDLCDGIVTPGGLKTYEYDYYICEYARTHDIPLLGICAGMQVMARNGSTFTNVKNESNIHTLGRDAHDVRIHSASLLYDILGKGLIRVNSMHGYHVPKVGKDTIVSGICSQDGVIEAIEDSSKRFCVGVQWHPEQLIFEDENSKRLFTYFVDEASKTKSLKRF